MPTQKYTKEQEIMILKQAFNMLNSLSVTGPKQAGILAQAGDHILAVVNSMSEDIKPKQELNGAVKEGESAVV